MRKGYTKFTLQDFEESPIWELQGSLTMAEPYKGKIPFEADPARAYFVRASFKLADRTKMKGWTMICVPPYDVQSLNPTILTDAGPLDLTKLASRPKKKDVEAAYNKLGKAADKIFPLQFEADISVPQGPARGEMKGFLHRLTYLDDNGWRKHLDFCYQTAAELAGAIKEFEDSEAKRKAALEPSKDEKALFEAARCGNVKQVAALAARGVNVNCSGVVEEGGYTRKKVTPLMLAAETGHADVLLALLQSGADISLTEETNEPRRGNRTALACACRKNKTETAGILLNAGADPNHRLNFGHTIFDEACYEGEMDMLELLLKNGANPNASCGKDYFALERGVSAGRVEVLELLLNSGADINGADDDEETVLIRAARLLRYQMVKLLLDRGADVQRATYGKKTALHRVVATATDLSPEWDEDAKEKFAVAFKIVKALVAAGADVNANTRDGDKPLTLAKECKFPELAKYLIQKGAKG